MNVLGFPWPDPNGIEASAEKNIRINAALDYLKSSNIDIVFLQELWVYEDFLKFRSIYPYSSYFGNPNSYICSQVK